MSVAPREIVLRNYEDFIKFTTFTDNISNESDNQTRPISSKSAPEQVSSMNGEVYLCTRTASAMKATNKNRSQAAELDSARDYSLANLQSWSSGP